MPISEKRFVKKYQRINTNSATKNVLSRKEKKKKKEKKSRRNVEEEIYS